MYQPLESDEEKTRRRIAKDSTVLAQSYALAKHFDFYFSPVPSLNGPATTADSDQIKMLLVGSFPLP